MKFNYTIKNQKGFIPIIIIIVVLLGVFGFYYLTRSNSKSILESPIPTTISAIDSTTNWKTYSHNNPDFVLLYPPTWSYNLEQNVAFEGADPNYNLIFDGPEGQVLIDWSINGGLGGSCESFSQIKINNELIQACIDNINTKKESWRMIDSFEKMIGTTAFSVRTNFDGTHQTDKDVILKILSTFKFTK